IRGTVSSARTAQDLDSVHVLGRRTRSSGDRSAVPLVQGNPVQERARLRSLDPAAAPQPHVGELFDQHERQAAEQSDTGVRENGEVNPYRGNGESSSPGFSRRSRSGLHDGATSIEMAGTNPAMTAEDISQLTFRVDISGHLIAFSNFVMAG